MPMRLRPALLTCLLTCLLLAAAPAFAAEPVRAVEALDIDRYAGQWHEIAHLPVSFQKQCVGEITANYGLRRDGRISVTNACRNREGERVVADGVARPVEGQPGQLQVRFAPDWLSWVPLVWADYWVIALDPEYQWAVVGEPDRRYLWILSRLPEMDRTLFEQLKAKAEAMGYDLAPLKMMAPLRDPAPTSTD
ncbi:lipocalin family protein [Stenotrophomonas sp. S41]|uniref:lipocalin family protein n=1 Tax=Stenotrophomonas sp. S41 TaxID=2767464 RepID=UPI00190B4E1F|nr:lipocalin family protein [Stenotrophomonas sp. S41]MBK0012019.1 lipocalin family protein [Stenotrophomonas sp. S41]